MDEPSLIQRVQRGESEAFGDLVGLHAVRLRRILALTAPAAHLIDELAQETLVFAFTHIREFRRGTSFSSWLAAIARNLVRREVLRFSRERVNRVRYAEGRSASPPPREPDSARLERLDAVLRAESPRTRTLLEWRYRDALPAAEIARRLGWSASCVRTTLSRLRRDLRLRLESP